jgi:hypothetical protein
MSDKISNVNHVHNKCLYIYKDKKDILKGRGYKLLLNLVLSIIHSILINEKF